MRIVVAGGTGMVGRLVVSALGRRGHDAKVLSRSHGVDLSSGAGLDVALEGVDAVIDVTNARTTSPDEARRLFGGLTTNLLAAERRAGVKHHVLLSIVGVDRLTGSPHYEGKRAQEALVKAGGVPWTIQRATQFHEFAPQTLSWTRKGGTAMIPPLLLQPVAASDVADALAGLGAGAPQGALDLAGPGPEDLVDMVRRYIVARGESVTLIPSWRSGLFGVESAGEWFLPGPGATLAPTTFQDWLAQQIA
ncbi:MAG: NAD-dependent epimerase/dehydratase family protein [Acidobacteria bacterium]|nr:MAG: NAD-dependent epimerase/dehydratase family protein [Acidobacteriota bacterium]